MEVGIIFFQAQMIDASKNLCLWGEFTIISWITSRIVSIAALYNSELSTPKDSKRFNFTQPHQAQRPLLFI